LSIAALLVLTTQAVAADASRTGDNDQAGAQTDYELSYIGFDDFVVADHHVGVQRLTIPYEGKFKKPLDGPAFYEKLGRPDLVEAYQSRSDLRTSLMIAGGAVTLGGIVYGIVGMASSQQDCGAPSSPTFSSCVTSNSSFNATPLIVGGGLTLVGAALLVGGASINPDPLDVVQMRQLAEQYNEGLRRRGSISEGDPPPTPKPPEVRISLAPAASPTGGGLALGIAF
jgi:hypothetical protein